MDENKLLNKKHNFDLLENTSTRIPICLVIDTSGSMSFKDNLEKSRIERLRDGISKFFAEVKADEILAMSAEVAIVGFNDSAYEIRDFSVVDNHDDAIEFQVGGTGNLGRGVLAAITKLEERKKVYQQHYVDYHQPWLIILSDGKPTGEGAMSDLKKAQERTLKLEASRSLVVISVMISGDSSEQKHEMYDRKGYNYLRGFSKKNNPQMIGNVQFVKFFEWLSKSVALTFEDVDLLDFNALGQRSDDFDDL